MGNEVKLVSIKVFGCKTCHLYCSQPNEALIRKTGCTKLNCVRHIKCLEWYHYHHYRNELGQMGYQEIPLIEDNTISLELLRTKFPSAEGLVDKNGSIMNLLDGDIHPSTWKGWS